MTFNYDIYGRIIEETWQTPSNLGQATFTTRYAYDLEGKLNKIQYPSGAWMELKEGSDGRWSSLEFNNQPFIQNIQWDSLDRMKEWTWSASQQWTGGVSKVTRQWDINGRLISQEAHRRREYVWDSAWRLNAISDPVSTAHSAVFSMDNLDRLTEDNQGSLTSPLTFQYDTNGNRTRKLSNNGVDGWHYNYGTTHHRQTQRIPFINGQLGTAFVSSYDAMGNLINDGQNLQLSYDARGRWTETVSMGQIVRRGYTPDGLRLWTTEQGITTIYIHDAARRLIGVYTLDSNQPQGFSTKEELIYNQGFELIGTSRIDETNGFRKNYPVVPDQVLAPLVVLDPSDGAILWSWETRDAFGHSTPNENPSQRGVFVFDARMAGQWFDKATGLYHNGYRDYHPGIGRYMQSDPLGLFDGFNTYAYVGGNPLEGIDPYGLFDASRLPTFPQWIVNSSAGFGDTLSFNSTNFIREFLDVNHVVNECSEEYENGETTGLFFSLSFGGIHIGRGLINQGFKYNRIIYDPRNWNNVQRNWSKSVGGYKGKYELHHWFTPRSKGGSNAIWNYMPVSPKLNRKMSDGGFLFNGFKGSVISIYGGTPNYFIGE